MEIDKETSDILREIVELGYIQVKDGKVTQSQEPLCNVISYRWQYTLKYIRDYALANPDFGGDFFVCLYDGWCEYTEPVLDPLLRKYVPWRDIPPPDRRNHYLGTGMCGEPRFCAAYLPDVIDPAIYPELPHPVLTYGRHVEDKNAVLIPDIMFIEGHYPPFQQLVEQNDIPFSQKESKIYWRGSKYNIDGYSYLPPDKSFGERAHPRNVAVRVAQDPLISDIMNVSFENTCIPDMLKYKYQLDIDGMVSTWTASYWKMLSQSVVIRPRSHWEQWYSYLIKPYQHYLPLADFRPTTILDTYKYAEGNPQKMQTIVEESTSFAKTLTYEFAVNEYRIH